MADHLVSLWQRRSLALHAAPEALGSHERHREHHPARLGMTGRRLVALREQRGRRSTEIPFAALKVTRKDVGDAARATRTPKSDRDAWLCVRRVGAQEDAYARAAPIGRAYSYSPYPSPLTAFIRLIARVVLYLMHVPPKGPHETESPPQYSIAHTNMFGCDCMSARARTMDRRRMPRTEAAFRTACFRLKLGASLGFGARKV